MQKTGESNKKSIHKGMTFLPVIEMPYDGVEAAIIRPLDLIEIESINQVLKSTFSGRMVRKYIIPFFWIIADRSSPVRFHREDWEQGSNSPLFPVSVPNRWI